MTKSCKRDEVIPGEMEFQMIRERSLVSNRNGRCVENVNVSEPRESERKEAIKSFLLKHLTNETKLEEKEKYGKYFGSVFFSFIFLRSEPER